MSKAEDLMNKLFEEKKSQRGSELSEMAEEMKMSPRAQAAANNSDNRLEIIEETKELESKTRE